MADPYDDAALRAHEANDRLWGGLYEEARRRLRTDPLLSARVKATTGLLLHELRSVRGSAFVQDYDTVAGLAAAVALVIAERPELITGGRPTGVPPVEVIAARLAMIVGPYPTIRDAELAAAAVLTALALEGWEVTWRADRFATLERDTPRLRIPLRGTCGACHGPVDRVTELVGADVELLIGPWQHSYRQGTHPDTEIRDVTPR